jgi:hypothetical protein
MILAKASLIAAKLERNAMDLHHHVCSNFVLGLWVEFRQVLALVLTAIIFEHIDKF